MALVERVERLVQAAVEGRRAGKALSAWTRRFQVTEAEFQLLWSLNTTPQVGYTQIALARELAFSPAQISVVVERLRNRGWICQHHAQGDRRQHVWRLSVTGQSLLEEILCQADVLHDAPCFAAANVAHLQQEAVA